MRWGPCRLRGERRRDLIPGCPTVAPEGAKGWLIPPGSPRSVRRWWKKDGVLLVDQDPGGVVYCFSLSQDHDKLPVSVHEGVAQWSGNAVLKCVPPWRNGVAAGQQLGGRREQYLLIPRQAMVRAQTARYRTQVPTGST